jgi:hypothetical protein
MVRALSYGCRDPRDDAKAVGRCEWPRVLACAVLRVIRESEGLTNTEQKTPPA